MPRVDTRTKTTRGRSEFPCRMCSEPIVAGQVYRTWKSRVSGRSYMHASHGQPRPSMLSSRKTAQIEDAMVDADFSREDSVEGLTGILEGIAQTARDVGEEYRDGADNMPESLQYGAQAEAMREVAEELEAWADQLEAWEPEADEPIESDDPLAEGEEERLEERREAWLEEIRQEARDALDNEPMPEYQG